MQMGRMQSVVPNSLGISVSLAGRKPELTPALVNPGMPSGSARTHIKLL